MEVGVCTMAIYKGVIGVLCAGWIAAARLEEVTGHKQSARNIIHHQGL